MPLQTDESENTPKTFTNSSLHCCSVHSKLSFCRNLVTYPHWFVLFPCVNQFCHFLVSSYNFAKINFFFFLPWLFLKKKRKTRILFSGTQKWKVYAERCSVVTKAEEFSEGRLWVLKRFSFKWKSLPKKNKNCREDIVNTRMVQEWNPVKWN